MLVDLNVKVLKPKVCCCHTNDDKVMSDCMPWKPMC